MSSNREKPVSSQVGYNEWSAFYDEYPNPTVAADEFHFPKFWQHLTGKSVLEIGCGTGRHTQKLVEQGNHVTGIDVSSGMLAVARTKVSSEKATFIEADFLQYSELPASAFDAVIVSLVIEHISALTQFFRKVSNALRSSGELYISEIHPSRASDGILAHFKKDEGGEVHLVSFAHSSVEIETSASVNQLVLLESIDIVGEQKLAELKPKWQKYLGQPMVKIWTFRKF
jgi:ubiquinone/menaquinone biosynthesis C-methylase UbiE